MDEMPNKFSYPHKCTREFGHCLCMINVDIVNGLNPKTFCASYHCTRYNVRRTNREGVAILTESMY